MPTKSKPSQSRAKPAGKRSEKGAQKQKTRRDAGGEEDRTEPWLGPLREVEDRSADDDD